MKQAMRTRSICRLTLAAGIAVMTLGWSLPSPAYAENRGEHWRGEHRYGGYYRSPGNYYAPPPVIYQPYGYYQQPGASLNFNFPLRFR